LTFPIHLTLEAVKTIFQEGKMKKNLLCTISILAILRFIANMALAGAMQKGEEEVFK